MPQRSIVSCNSYILVYQKSLQMLHIKVLYFVPFSANPLLVKTNFKKQTSILPLYRFTITSEHLLLLRRFSIQKVKSLLWSLKRVQTHNNYRSFYEQPKLRIKA